ncbi:MAG: hypothetical protein ABIR32_09360 [Ilumatobacteraceae bacterium]
MTRTGRNALCLVVALVVGGGLAAVSLAVPAEVRGPVTADEPADRLTPPISPSRSPVIAGCSIYPADNAWNMRVDGLPRRVGSAATIARIQAVGSDNLHPDFGENPEYGIPFVVVPADQPLVPITYTEAGNESDPGPFPIPLDAPVEGGNGSSGDRHVIVLQQGTCQLHELYSSYRSGGGWEAYSGARFDLASNALRPLGWTSADAAGLPILPGLVRYDEVAAGVINHAIRVTFAQTQASYILPATHEASSRTDADLPPMGMRLRLRAGFDLSGLSGQARVIAVAMQQYGLIVADNGSNWFFQGAPSPGWVDDDLSQLKNIPGTAFEVVDTGPTHS